MALPDWVRHIDEFPAEILIADADQVLSRSRRLEEGAETVLLVRPANEPASPEIVARVNNEFSLRAHLDEGWSVRPLHLEQSHGALTLFLTDPGGEALTQQIGAPLSPRRFLKIAIAISEAVARMHEAGLLHKDIKPSNILVATSYTNAWLTGFGIATRLPRERQTPAPPEIIAGTLAYMAPEQTGRMNRSIDSRSDLYSLGVTFYQMLTGVLPFSASDAVEWIHCHIARQPDSPTERVPGIPEILSAIVMKLLSKAAEERYRTASGLKADLERCLRDLELTGGMPQFKLGSQDAANRLVFREKLYGREKEVDRLRSVLNHVVDTGAPSVVLVSGYSGIGKSSIVQELHRSLVSPHGLFAAGKFDQYKRDIPYAPLAQAFQGLVKQLLSKDEGELAYWRDAFSEALDANGQLIVNLVPELEHIIGCQPAVPDLSGLEAKRRFRLAFKQFIGVFARPEHPLVLFLDDMQWLDSATLDVFENLALERDLGCLLLVGAYRENEVGQGHPLRKRLDGIRGAGASLHEIQLDGMSREDVTLMIADALEDQPENVTSMAGIVFDKTGGNPFFVTQFVATLVDDGLLYFDASRAGWRWDADRIADKHVSDNIVDLMVLRLRRLPPEALHALQQLACLGSSTKVTLFQCVTGASREETQGLLHDASLNGLIHQVGDTYAFTHDRVHEAAYALLAGPERQALHRRIAFTLRDAFGEAEIDAEIFDTVSHFNRGGLEGVSLADRHRFASLNLRAGRKAKAGAAYAAACSYLAQARVQLGDTGWRIDFRLAFAVALEQAECTFLSGEVEETERMIADLLRYATDNVDRAVVYRLEVGVKLVKSNSQGAVQSALDGLRLLGIDLIPQPTMDDIQEEYDNIWQNLAGRSIASLTDLPPMTDPAALAAMRLLAEMQPPAYFSSYNMTILVICRMVNLTLAKGIANESAQGVALLGYVMGPVFGRYAEGYRIAELASELAKRQAGPVDMARVKHLTGLAAAWTHPLPLAIDWLRAAFRGGLAAGDLYYGCFEIGMVVLHLFQSGQNLEEVDEECQQALEFARQTGFPAGIGVVGATERAVASLRGRTRGLSNYGDEELDEHAAEAYFSARTHPIVARYYWTRKVMLHVLAEEYESALMCAQNVQSEPPLRNMQIEQIDYHYYCALAVAALIGAAPKAEHETMLARISAHLSSLTVWAKEAGSPAFADKPILIAAELARLQGREMEAQQLYEESIRVARQNGFIQNEAVAHEVASRFYAGRGFEKIARLYLREARSCYARWGATAKVRQLDGAYPFLRDEVPALVTGRTTVAPVDHFDLSTVTRVAQSVSGEIVLEKLLDALMRTVIEHAGAGRVVLMLADGIDHRAEAEAMMSDHGIVVRLKTEMKTAVGLPETVVQYVTRTRETLILDDALMAPLFAGDSYIRMNRVRSLLALPLINQGKLNGLLYLENNLATNVFTPLRISILKLIASHAAIALENTRLYRDLEEREAKIRRLIDADIIGVYMWDFDGLIFESNDTFLNMVGYDRDDLAAGRLNWEHLSPADGLENDARIVAEVRATGRARPFEKEFFHKDGHRIPVLIGAATFGETDSERGVAYVLDLTSRREAEEAARAGDQRYRELQLELAHANRVATIGQLSAAISHDVRQPLVGVVTSGSAGLNWLGADPPNIAAARRALERVVGEGHRAASVLERTRALVKKVPPRTEKISINTVICETAELVSAQAQQKNVILTLALDRNPPQVLADKVQLQQVILNLAVNAIEAMGETTTTRRKLTISSTRETAEQIVVSISDTGPGIPDMMRDELFKAFYSTKQDGMGMGLAISRTIVEAHGGELGVGENFPQGAVFWFSLPSQPDEAVLN